MLKNKYVFFSLFIISALILSSSNIKAATIHKDDTDDVYSVSLLGFFSTIGDAFDDPPEDGDELLSYISELVASSAKTNEHDEVDLTEAQYESDAGASAIFIKFDADIEDEEMWILGYGEHNNKQFSFYIILNGSSTGVAIYSSEESGNTTETTAWIDNGEVAFVFNTTDFDWEKGDTLIIFALTIPGSFESYFDALNAKVYYDFLPNNAVKDEGSYTGDDIITNFIDSIAEFLFGYLPGGLPFKLLLTLLIVLGSVLLDRKNKYLHAIGAIFLLLFYYPLFMYSLSIDFTSALGINFMSILELLIVITMGLYIAIAFLVSFKLIRRKNYMFLIAAILMICESILFLTLFNPGGTQYTINVWVLSGILVASWIALIFSRKKGRTPK